MTERLLQQVEAALRRGNIPSCMRLCQQGLAAISQKRAPYTWAVLHSRLGQCYLSRSGGEVAEDVEASIHHFQLALRRFTWRAHAVEWATCHDFLGLAFWLRRQGYRSANIEAAIAHYQKALQVWTRARAPEIWAGIQDGLADAFRERMQGNSAENLRQAIHRYQNALEVWTPEENAPQWAGAHVDLADLYREMRQVVPRQPLEAAIHHYKLALQVISRKRAPARWARIQHGLGECYGERSQGQRDRNLEQSIAHYEQALLVYEQETHPEEWASTMSNLGVSYQHRSGGNQADNVQCAIRCFQQALQVYTQEEHPVAWSQTQTNLANAYLGSTGLQQADDTERAIGHFRAALEAIDAGSQPVLWATIQYNLANAFCQRRWWDMSRFLRGEGGLALKAEQRARDIETAIDHYQYALQVFRRDRMAQDWAMVQNSLGRAYCERIRGNRTANVEQAIEHLKQALTVRTRQQSPELWAATQLNLGVAYEARLVGKREENQREAEGCYREALGVFDADRYPLRARKALHNLARLYFGRGQWQAAVNSYEGAKATLGDPLTLLHSGRARAFDVETTASLYPDEAYCLLKLGQAGAAFSTLEEGRARLFHDALQSREDAQQGPAEGRLPTDVMKTIRQSFQAPGGEPTVSLADRGMALHSASYYYQTFGDGGELDDFVIHAPEAEEEPDATGESIKAPEGCALIAPVVTTCGGAVIVMTGKLNDLEMDSVIWLERMTEQAVASLLTTWMRTYIALQHAESETEQAQSREEWLAAISEVSGELWRLLFAPVHEYLEGCGLRRLILLPQSRLQLLPLHAAWRLENGERRYLLDDYEVSYAPSARMEMLCQERLQAPQSSGSLVVGVDSYRQLPSLSHAVAEAQVVAGFLETLPVVDDAAHKEVVLREIGGKGHLHFACHGRYGWQGQPLASALYVAGDEALSLDELISTRDLQGTRLVALSACESGIAALTASPDEYVGLAAGFLLLGAAGILSSLWLVDDRSTFLLMERFYHNHVTQKLPPAAALREAQCWMRDTTRQELGDYLKSLTGMEPGKAAAAYMDMALGGDPCEKPYVHPFYWAAFTFTGA